jgi:hypothetical protein
MVRGKAARQNERDRQAAGGACALHRTTLGTGFGEFLIQIKDFHG